MDDFPYKNVADFVLQMHTELIPAALRDRFQRQRTAPPWLDAAIERFSRRVTIFETDAELKAWLHSRASMSTWWALHWRMRQMHQCLVRATDGIQQEAEARRIAARLVGCPTALTSAMAAMSGPI